MPTRRQMVQTRHVARCTVERHGQAGAINGSASAWLSRCQQVVERGAITMPNRCAGYLAHPSAFVTTVRDASRWTNGVTRRLVVAGRCRGKRTDSAIVAPKRVQRLHRPARARWVRPRWLPAARVATCSRTGPAATAAGRPGCASQVRCWRAVGVVQQNNTPALRRGCCLVLSLLSRASPGRPPRPVPHPSWHRP